MPRDYPTVALLTDYGLRDSYVAEMKGAMLSVNPRLNLVDLSHEIAPYNITEAAYILRNAAREFPAGTVFVAVVDPGVGTDRNSIILQTDQGKYYVGPDNGLFGMLIKSEGFGRAWKLNNTDYFRPGPISDTFHGRDIYGPVAAHLVSGVSPDEMGEPISSSSLVTNNALTPSAAGAIVTATVLHIDRFGNVITNIPKAFSQHLEFDKLVRLSIGDSKKKKDFSAPLVKTFADVKKGQLALIYGGEGLLEVAVNQGSAAEKLKVQPGDQITLRP